MNNYDILGLGAVNYEAVCTVILNKPKTNLIRGSYKEYSHNKRFLEGQHASLNGTASTVRKRENVFRNLIKVQYLDLENARNP